jgi:electron transfer flavoprotein alpha subunit
MEKIWILAELRDGHPVRIVGEVAAAARQFGSTVEAVTWGGQSAETAAELGAHGISRVFDIGDLGDRLAGPAVAAVVAARISAGEGPNAILVGSTYNGRDVVARLSAKLDIPVITNVVGLEDVSGALESTHSVFGGEVTVKARFTSSGPALFVIRSKSFEAEEVGGSPAAVESWSVPELGSSNSAKIVARHIDPRTGPGLDDADIVVSGGRGLGSAEEFGLIEELATLVNGAPGASRAVVDAGWVPYSYQVGQTGKIVKPDVYLSFGISGATQHLVGMKGSKHIIAVDRDPAAPMLQIADLAVVSDVHELLPRLIEALKARSSAE